MKYNWTLLLFGAFFFVLLTSMKPSDPPTGSADLKVEMKTMDDLLVQLTAQNETGKKLYLSVLMQESGTSSRIAETTIYSEEISGDVATVTRTLNLSKLESGTYRIKIKAGKQHFERRVDIRTKPVTSDSRIISLN